MPADVRRESAPFGPNGFKPHLCLPGEVSAPSLSISHFRHRRPLSQSHPLFSQNIEFVSMGSDAPESKTVKEENGEVGIELEKAQTESARPSGAGILLVCRCAEVCPASAPKTDTA